jgi:hypothetical protein
MILGLLSEAHENGARLAKACEAMDISSRMVERWKASKSCEDGRKGPKSEPANKLTKSLSQ